MHKFFHAMSEHVDSNYTGTLSYSIVRLQNGKLDLNMEYINSPFFTTCSGEFNMYYAFPTYYARFCPNASLYTIDSDVMRLVNEMGHGDIAPRDVVPLGKHVIKFESTDGVLHYISIMHLDGAIHVQALNGADLDRGCHVYTNELVDSGNVLPSSTDDISTKKVTIDYGDGVGIPLDTNRYTLHNSLDIVVKFFQLMREGVAVVNQTEEDVIHPALLKAKSGCKQKNKRNQNVRYIRLSRVGQERSNRISEAHRIVECDPKRWHVGTWWRRPHYRSGTWIHGVMCYRRAGKLMNEQIETVVKL